MDFLWQISPMFMKENEKFKVSQLDRKMIVTNFADYHKELDLLTNLAQCNKLLSTSFTHFINKLECFSLFRHCCVLDARQTSFRRDYNY